MTGTCRGAPHDAWLIRRQNGGSRVSDASYLC
jgi:hypothetical protein